jgi:hypothetical protein
LLKQPDKQKLALQGHPVLLAILTPVRPCPFQEALDDVDLALCSGRRNPRFMLLHNRGIVDTSQKQPKDSDCGNSVDGPTREDRGALAYNRVAADED